MSLMVLYAKRIGGYDMQECIIRIVRIIAVTVVCYMLIGLLEKRLIVDFAALGYSPVEAVCAVKGDEMASRKMCINLGEVKKTE